MTGNTLSIVLDFIVLGFLGVTIFYAIRLTKSLNSFRAMRHEFGHIMKQLSNNIDDAQRGVDNLKAVTRDSGQHLQKLINEAKMIAGDLERLNKGAPLYSSQNSRRHMPPIEEETDPFKLLERELLQEDANEGGFSIFDREYEEDEPGPEIRKESPASFKSHAERELYEALQKKGRIA
jgi:hypothetical protein